MDVPRTEYGTTASSATRVANGDQTKSIMVVGAITKTRGFKDAIRIRGGLCERIHQFVAVAGRDPTSKGFPDRIIS